MKVVVIGGGMAAIRFAEKLRECAFEGEISIVSEERYLPYNRVLLSELMAGRVQESEIQLHEPEWYRTNNIALITGRVVVALDVQSKFIELADGQRLEYTTLVFATGSRPAIPSNISGTQEDTFLSGFRGIDDVRLINRRLKTARSVAVVGGGLLGLEAATAIASMGKPVSLFHRGSRLMNRQLDERAAELLRQRVLAMGIEVHLNSERPNEVHDLLVVAAGIAPEISLAARMGLDTNRGIRVDANFRTSIADIYAIGECAEIDGETAGLLAPMWNQVDQLIAHLVQRKQFKTFETSHAITRLKVSGIDMHVMGDIRSDDAWFVRLEDAKAGIYRKLVFRGSRLVGALLMGDVSHSRAYLEQIASGRDVGEDGARLQFAGPTAELEEAPCI